MLLKLCCALPIYKNSLKSIKTLSFIPNNIKILKNPIGIAHFCQITQYRCLSIDKNIKKLENSVKQVYYGGLTPQIKAVKMFSFSSSIVGLIGQPFLYKEIVSTGNVPVIIAAYSFIGFFTVVTPVLLHLITKKYVTHLSYNEKNGSYVAKTVNFFCMTQETEFSPEEVKVPDVPGMFTTIHVKGKALFLDPRQFQQPEHYGKIMGYDKPIDFKLYETDGPPIKSGSDK